MNNSDQINMAVTITEGSDIEILKSTASATVGVIPTYNSFSFIQPKSKVATISFSLGGIIANYSYSIYVTPIVWPS
jgi:hypothetical protein